MLCIIYIPCYHRAIAKTHSSKLSCTLTYTYVVVVSPPLCRTFAGKRYSGDPCGESSRRFSMWFRRLSSSACARRRSPRLRVQPGGRARNKAGSFGLQAHLRAEALYGQAEQTKTRASLQGTPVRQILTADCPPETGSCIQYHPPSRLHPVKESKFGSCFDNERCST